MLGNFFAVNFFYPNMFILKQGFANLLYLIFAVSIEKLSTYFFSYLKK